MKTIERELNDDCFKSCFKFHPFQLASPWPPRMVGHGFFGIYHMALHFGTLDFSTGKSW